LREPQEPQELRVLRDPLEPQELRVYRDQQATLEMLAQQEPLVHKASLERPARVFH